MPAQRSAASNHSRRIGRLAEIAGFGGESFLEGRLMLDWLSPDAFRERLIPLMEESKQGAVVFDADGTLWRHDVGALVFDHALELGVLREEALAELTLVAKAQGVQIESSTNANAVAAKVAFAYYADAFDEKVAAELQVWAYAGLTESEFRQLTRDALAKGKHSLGIHQPIAELADWVRLQGHRSLIVSASPRWVVEEASRALGFSAEEIAAGDPLMSKDEPPRVRCGMAAPLPYGPDKVTAGRALLGDLTWLAALGDSSFDLEMFRVAQLAAGIGDKATMLQGLAPLPHGYRLEF